jgi:hypothetical protein
MRCPGTGVRKSVRQTDCLLQGQIWGTSIHKSVRQTVQVRADQGHSPLQLCQTDWQFFAWAESCYSGVSDRLTIILRAYLGHQDREIPSHQQCSIASRGAVQNLLCPTYRAPCLPLRLPAASDARHRQLSPQILLTRTPPRT